MKNRYFEEQIHWVPLNEGRERQDKDFLFLFLNFDTVAESTPEEFPNIKEIV